MLSEEENYIGSLVFDGTVSEVDFLFENNLKVVPGFVKIDGLLRTQENLG